MGNIHEIRCKTGIAVTRHSRLADPLQLTGHCPLLVLLCGEAGKRRHGNIGHLVIGRSRKRGIHDDKIKSLVGNIDASVLAAGAAEQLLPTCAKEGYGGFLVNQIQSSQGCRAAGISGLLSIGQRNNRGTGKRHFRMGTGQHRGCKVSRRGHNIGADKRCLHHRGMEFSIVPAITSITGENGLISCIEQCSRAAGEVGNSQCLHCLLIRPVRAEACNGKLRQQRSRTGQCVEGGQELPVGNQALEHAAAEVVLACGAKHCQFRTQFRHSLKDHVRYFIVDRHKKIGRDLENRPVVDLAKDAAPVPRHVDFWNPSDYTAQVVECLDNERPIFIAGAGNGRLENQRVRDNGHGHSCCLNSLLLMQRICNSLKWLRYLGAVLT